MKKQKTTEIPEEVKKVLGTTRTISGCIFSKKEIEPQDFKILDWRWGSSQIMDMNSLKIKHPTFELLVKNDTMKASRWTKPFPCYSVKLKDI